MSSIASRAATACLLVLAGLGLGGCDLLGIESPQDIAARKEADGKAVGGACRHAGRAIEDCYALNRKADRAAVFAGWREMNDYMRENKIDAVAPQLGPPTEVAAKAPSDDEPKKPGKADKAEKADAKAEKAGKSHDS